MINYSFLVIVVLLAGCASYPKHTLEQTNVEIPLQWSDNQGLSSPPQPWLADFDDPKLSALVQEAIENNYDLQSAAARMEAALATAKINGADRLPEISSQFGASRSHAGDSRTATSTITDLGLTIKWELDLWGKLRNQARAALLEYQASKAHVKAARLSIAVNTARLFFDAIESKEQVQLSEQTLQSFRKSLEIIEDGFQVGISSALDVRLSRASVAGAESNLEFEKARHDAIVRSLEVLAGRYPNFQSAIPEKLPSIKLDIPAGLPSEILGRRPDLMEAEMRLAASDERLQQVGKNRLPGIQLTGSGGTSSNALKNLFDLDFLLLSIAADLSQPIFEGGRLTAQVDLSRAKTKEALADYAMIVLNAFKEVETALSAKELLSRQETALRTAQEESMEAEALALEEYTKGIVDIITLLESQRRSFQAQKSLLQIQNQRLQNSLDLYLALGGEFT